MNVSFDFDDTIHLEGEINYSVRNHIFDHHEAGHKIYIITARSGREDTWFPKIRKFVREYSLPIEDVIFTNHYPKGPFAKELGIELHYDDKLDHLDSCLELGIRAIWVDNESLFEYTGNDMKRIHP